MQVNVSPNALMDSALRHLHAAIGTCEHRLLFLGTHPDFRKGWLCKECRQYVDLGTLDGYVVVLAAVREGGAHAQEEMERKAAAYRAGKES